MSSGIMISSFHFEFQRRIYLWEVMKFDIMFSLLLKTIKSRVEIELFISPQIFIKRDEFQFIQSLDICRFFSELIKLQSFFITACDIGRCQNLPFCYNNHSLL